VIRLVQWSAEAEHLLGRALNAGGIADIREEVRRGVSQLWEFADELGQCGYAVTRVERYPSGDEWCWVACAGRDFMKYARLLKLEAERRGLTVRVHLTSKAMQRWYGRLGFKVSETIMRAEHGAVGRRQELA
jgi:hypothetical protein